MHSVFNKENEFLPYSQLNPSSIASISRMSSWSSSHKNNIIGFSGFAIPTTSSIVSEKSKRLNFMFNGRITNPDTYLDEFRQNKSLDYNRRVFSINLCLCILKTIWIIKFNTKYF